MKINGINNRGAIGQALALNPGGLADDTTDGGYYYAPPADSGSDYSGDYGFDYYDTANGIYYDSYGNAWDVVGSGIFSNQDFTPDATDENGFPILNINTTGSDPLKEIDLSALGQTLDWWQAINADPSLPTVLPAVPVSIPLILQVPDSGIIPPGLVLPPVFNAMPPKQLAAIKKALQNQIQKAAASSSPSGASAGSKPQAVKPSAGGQCPAGYAMSAGGYCVLKQTSAAQSQTLSGILQNPIYLIGGAILLVLLAKK